MDEPLNDPEDRDSPRAGGTPAGPHPSLYCGVDVGASATKVVLLDSEGAVRARVVHPSGINYQLTAARCLDEALAAAGAAGTGIRGAVSTGYGRRNVAFAASSATEIHCHGVGCHHFAPRTISVVDIGGQDNKVIHLESDGRRVDFKMNRKCAAGTGAFLEEIALRLGLPLEDLDRLAGSAPHAVPLSSFCTVFAKTEILAHLRQGVPVEGIVRGAFASVITRVVEMDSLPGEVVLTGGVVAHNPTIAEIFSERLGRTVTIPPYPQFTGALGAALLALAQSEDA